MPRLIFIDGLAVKMLDGKGRGAVELLPPSLEEEMKQRSLSLELNGDKDYDVILIGRRIHSNIASYPGDTHLIVPVGTPALTLAEQSTINKVAEHLKSSVRVIDTQRGLLLTQSY